ncbi:MAG TPA: hypothetical protein VMT34_15950, partial [Aggregatilineales bacterium]|nr:hypothetical protein [Aggregatilineales bacterium]
TMTLPAQADETIDSLAWSQAGDQIASSGQDGTIALWNPITGDLISRLKGHSGPVRGVVWSADGSKVVSAGDDGSVQIWQNEQHLATIAAHDASIVALAWRPQSGQFASVDCDGWLRVWNIDTQSAEITLPVGPTLALAWSPDGQHLALGGDDSIRIFDVRRKPEARVDGAQAMTIKPYRVIASALAIRAQPRTGDQFRTGQTLKFDELINVDESSRVTADGIVWLHHDRGWSAERTLDGKSVYLLDAALRPKDRQWGINIDPANPFGSPPAARLFGLGWVRFVFHFQSKYSSLDQAYAFYDPIIKAYQNTGTHVLLVLLQDTYRGNSPWSNNQGWDTFAMGFANTALRIASHYKGQVAAYEIWNEGDLPASAQTIQTSIYVPPEQYGPLLVLTSAAIKGGDPAAKVISGGLASSDPTGYLTKVNASINPPGRISLPVDAIAIHPYGRTPPGGAPFVGWSQGSLGDAISRLSDAFPLVPLWITEIGVPRVDVSNQAFWPGIANYMNKTFQLIRNDYFHIVPVVIWFAWADAMDNAGVVTNSQQPKGPIFDAFMTCLHADQVVYARQTATPFDGKIILTHVTGASVTENTVGQLATTINANAANAKAILVRTSIGASWASAFDGKPAMAIGGTNDLAHWAAELARYRIDLHAWHFLRGDGSDAEISLMAQAGTASGVMSLVLDLDPDALQLRSVDDIRTFMIALRAQYKGHLGVSFDGRPERFSSVHLLEWYPFVNSWHPKLFNWQYSNGSQTPDVYFVALTNALKPYPRPIIPIVGAEAVAGRPVPPDQIRGAGALAFATYNLPAVSYWKTGAIGPAEFTAIQSVVIPWFTAMIPVAGSADFVVVQTTSSLRIRSTPDINGAVVGALQPGDRITVRERRVSGAQLWVRHDKGWSLARNGATGEIYLA